MKRFIKMCCSGLSGMIVQIVLFNILRLHLHAAIANVIAIEAAIITNFFAHNFISFAEFKLTQQHSLRVWLKKFSVFNSCALFSMGIQTLLMLVGITFFGSSWMIANVLLLLGIMVGGLTNYFSYKTFVWHE